MLQKRKFYSWFWKTHQFMSTIFIQRRLISIFILFCCNLRKWIKTAIAFWRKKTFSFWIIKKQKLFFWFKIQSTSPKRLAKEDCIKTAIWQQIKADCLLSSSILFFEKNLFSSFCFLFKLWMFFLIRFCKYEKLLFKLTTAPFVFPDS
jgi:hypothetical protein